MLFRALPTIGTYDVAHVEEIPFDIKVADPHRRRNEARFDLCDLHCEIGNNKPLGLSWPGMVERTKAHALESAMGESTERQVRGRLAGCVLVRRSEQGALIER